MKGFLGFAHGVAAAATLLIEVEKVSRRSQVVALILEANPIGFVGAGGFYLGWYWWASIPWISFASFLAVVLTGCDMYRPAANPEFEIVNFEASFSFSALAGQEW